MYNDTHAEFSPLIVKRIVQEVSVSSSVGVNTSIWDRLGIGLSGLCAVHCLLTSILLAVLPLWSLAFQVEAWVHPVFAVLLIPTTLLAIRRAVRHGHPKAVTVLLAVGLVVILAALVAGHGAGAGVWVEALVTLFGSSLLITGHWRNWRGCTHDGLGPEACDVRKKSMTHDS